jgi:predicted transcriptional regulator
MAEQDARPAADPYRVAHIVSSYVRHHQIGPDQLAELIAEVHQALAGLGRAAPPIRGSAEAGGRNSTIGAA